MGGAAGMTAGVVAASLLLPGVGTVFALGFGAAALLGLAGAGAGAGVGSAAGSDADAPQPTADEKCFRGSGVFPRSAQRGPFADRGADRFAGARHFVMRSS